MFDGLCGRCESEADEAHEERLQQAPRPWRVDVQQLKHTTRVRVLDAQGNEVLQAQGETVAEAQQVAAWVVDRANVGAPRIPESKPTAPANPDDLRF